MPFGVLSGVPNVITHAKFCVNRLRGFSAAAPRKVPFPILFWTTLTTVLHYRADCDLCPVLLSPRLCSAPWLLCPTARCRKCPSAVTISNVSYRERWRARRILHRNVTCLLLHWGTSHASNSFLVDFIRRFSDSPHYTFTYRVLSRVKQKPTRLLRQTPQARS